MYENFRLNDGLQMPLVTFKGNSTLKNIAYNEHLCLIKSLILHESDNLGEITKMFANKIIHF